MSKPITDSWATQDSRYHDGQLLKVITGEFRGKTLRVNGRGSFWTQRYDENNEVIPDAGNWEIVLDIWIEDEQRPEGAWVGLVRASEREVSRMTSEIAI